jgi:hypothetical protein
MGYYEGTFGDKYSYREAQITAVNTLEPVTPMKLHNGYYVSCMGKRIIKRTCINAADYRSNLYRDLDDFTLVNSCLHISAQLPSPASEFNSILHQNLMNNIADNCRDILKDVIQNNSGETSSLIHRLMN